MRARGPGDCSGRGRTADGAPSFSSGSDPGAISLPSTSRLASLNGSDNRKIQGAYSLIQATKPAKLAFAMADSPVGVAAWIVEAFHAWSDRRERPFDEIFTRDQLLTEIMLYLVTDAFATSIWISGAKLGEEMTLPTGKRVEVPTGLSAFPDPVFPMPPRAVAETSHNVVHYSTMDAGGHFPFYERPDALIDELRTFSRLL